MRQSTPSRNPHAVVSEKCLTAVWAAVTHDPTASCDEIAARIGYASKSHVSKALHILRDAGYIEFADRANRARRVLVPLAVQPIIVQRRDP